MILDKAPSMITYNQHIKGYSFISAEMTQQCNHESDHESKDPFLLEVGRDVSGTATQCKSSGQWQVLITGISPPAACLYGIFLLKPVLAMYWGTVGKRNRSLLSFSFLTYKESITTADFSTDWRYSGSSACTLGCSINKTISLSNLFS